ncbi:MAG: hypothetical protein S4CHLAM2_02630 [Chlamydiales bacterium]|nr:hypothetical protein [Chlamydiales bacterium]
MSSKVPPSREPSGRRESRERLPENTRARQAISPGPLSMGEKINYFFEWVIAHFSSREKYLEKIQPSFPQTELLKDFTSTELFLLEPILRNPHVNEYLDTFSSDEEKVGTLKQLLANPRLAADPRRYALDQLLIDAVQSGISGEAPEYQENSVYKLLEPLGFAYTYETNVQGSHQLITIYVKNTKTDETEFVASTIPKNLTLEELLSYLQHPTASKLDSKKQEATQRFSDKMHKRLEETTQRLLSPLPARSSSDLDISLMVKKYEEELTALDAIPYIMADTATHNRVAALLQEDPSKVLLVFNTLRGIQKEYPETAEIESAQNVIRQLLGMDRKEIEAIIREPKKWGKRDV